MIKNIDIGSKLLAKNIHDILFIAIGHEKEKRALVISDHQSELSKLITSAYLECLPKAQYLDFDKEPSERILQSFDQMDAGDLVVLIQSTSFRLNAFRIRVELFKRGLKVIEHPHLGRMNGNEIVYYIDSLAYDPGYYRVVGPALKAHIDKASSATLDSGGEFLIYNSAFESAKLNTGDYSNQNNVGGQFPIGEVFTEPKDLEKVNGRVRIAVFGDTNFCVNKPKKPMTLVIERGRITSIIDSTPEFDEVIAKIREREGEIWIRELGFGMNKAFTSERTVSDIGTYERMCGIHLSLGVKHGVYKKPNFKQRDGGFHVDVFPVTHIVKLDEEIVYQNGAWTV